MVHTFGKMLQVLCMVLVVASANASSKIWEGIIVKIDGTKVYYKPQYTPYASAGLYPIFCDTPEKEGKLLMIDFGITIGDNVVHVPCIDDIPATGAEVIAAAKPGMRIIGFMNRKQWHYVSLVVRNAGVEVGYVTNFSDGTLGMRRPQANWPAQMSNKETWSNKQFPDREFELTVPAQVVGQARWQPVDAASLLVPGKAVMVIPAAAMRVEWIPQAAERWDPNKEPLKGNYGEYPKRSNPQIDEKFYQHAASGYLLEAKAVTRSIDNHGSGNPKDRDTWKIDVPYGPKQGEYILPSRGHKTQTIIAGHFNTFPTIPVMKQGRRVTAWAYRMQRAPNFKLFDAHEMLVEGSIEAVNGDTITLSVPSKDGPREYTHKLDTNAEFVSLGRALARDQVLTVGHVIRIYAAHPFTVVAGK